MKPDLTIVLAFSSVSQTDAIGDRCPMFPDSDASRETARVHSRAQTQEAMHGLSDDGILIKSTRYANTQQLELTLAHS